jgi:seryl-tRNA synthetase
MSQEDLTTKEVSMTEEQEVQTSQETEAREPVEETQVETQVATSDVTELITESKKYRKRAQSAEKKLDQLQKRIDADRQKEMEEREEWKALAEERATKLSEMEPIVERATALEAAMRDELLADFPEEEREDYEDLPTPVLRKVHGKIINQKPAKTDSSLAGFSSVPSKKMSEMTKEERRENWSGIIAGYMK